MGESKGGAGTQASEAKLVGEPGEEALRFFEPMGGEKS